jgi:hypothetical protein
MAHLYGRAPHRMSEEKRSIWVAVAVAVVVAVAIANAMMRS